jgi:hypothetical protein
MEVVMGNWIEKLVFWGTLGIWSWVLAACVWYAL